VAKAWRRRESAWKSIISAANEQSGGEKIEFEVLATPRLAQQKPNRCLRLKYLPVSGPSSVGLVVKLEFEHLPAERGLPTEGSPPAAAVTIDLGRTIKGKAHGHEGTDRSYLLGSPPRMVPIPIDCSTERAENPRESRGNATVQSHRTCQS
jgi:hypothetical protein